MAGEGQTGKENLLRIRVGFDLPNAMVAKLDAEAKRRGVTRQALIKMWVSDRLDRAA